KLDFALAIRAARCLIGNPSFHQATHPSVRRPAMSRRYLFGPVSPHFADRYLRGLPPGECLPFSPDGSAGIAVGPHDGWDEILPRFPDVSLPVFVLPSLPPAVPPPARWRAPVPLAGWPPAATLLWDGSRDLARCELVLTDTPTAGALRREGIPQARPANLFGL